MAGRRKHSSAGVVAYRRGDRRQRATRAPGGVVEVDADLLESLLHPQAVNNGNRLSPKGTCYDCGRAVSGERKFCGTCLVKHGKV